MKTVRCRNCKKHYEINVGFPTLCPECLQKEKEECELAREFVRNHPGVTIDVVERETKVERRKILQYIYEEKLEIYPGAESFLRCKGCGGVIYTGVYCDKCKSSKTVV